MFHFFSFCLFLFQDGVNLLSQCVEAQYENVVELLLSILNSEKVAINEDDQSEENEKKKDVGKVESHRVSVSAVKNAIFSLFSTENKENKDNKDNKDHKETEVIEVKDEKETKDINTMVSDGITLRNYADMRVVSKYTYRGAPGHREMVSRLPLLYAVVVAVVG